MKPTSPALLLLLLLACPAPAAERVPVLIDTDIGTGIGDPFALALALGSYELDVRGVTAVGGPTHDRAMMLCRFLTMTGRRHLSVAEGEAPQPSRPITDQAKYHYHPDPIFNRTTKPVKQAAADFLYERVKGQPGKVTIIALGPLTNVARLLDRHADAGKVIRRVILLEDNIKLDADAAKKVYGSGVPLIVVSSSACKGLTLDEAGVKQAFSPGTPLTRQVETLYQMRDKKGAPLGEALAVALAFDEKHATIEAMKKGNVRGVTAVRSKEFAKWYTERMASLVAPSKRPVKFVERGNMPLRVHVAEDYDNDIERFWWMSGKAEVRNLPPGSKRACRAVLTHDFDDLLMVSRTMYKAVIFNPVPGPPMGKNTRLSFRYWLKGSDSLRVQIYSLTNGYHRHLVVKGVPQGKWTSATVDMTQARRPDGTGGPLGENERIDDIQFYVDADAELIIDDVVLYDAAAKDEKRPFPKRIIYTAGFATGAKGKEWKGDYDIVPDDGAFWKAARSVQNAKTEAPWIRLDLKGQRPVGEKVRLTFRYRLTGADRISVELANTAEGKPVVAELKGAKKGEWASAELTFDVGKLKSVNEVRFLFPKGAEALIDDVLLFEPGE
jgi:inosine-uridine nucleoside N-ribohydrolase